MLPAEQVIIGQSIAHPKQIIPRWGIAVGAIAETGLITMLVCGILFLLVPYLAANTNTLACKIFIGIGAPGGIGIGIGTYFLFKKLLESKKLVQQDVDAILHHPNEHDLVIADIEFPGTAYRVQRIQAGGNAITIPEAIVLPGEGERHVLHVFDSAEALNTYVKETYPK